MPVRGAGLPLEKLLVFGLFGPSGASNRRLPGGRLSVVTRVLKAPKDNRTYDKTAAIPVQEPAYMLENFWKDKYPAGVSPEIDPDQYPNVLAVLKDSCQRFANKPAFTNLGKTLTYGEQ